MLSTAAMIVTGSLMMISPLNESSVQIRTEAMTITCEEAKTIQVSYAVTVDTPEAEMDKIQAAAEKAGLKFDYRYRGIITRLVITMVYEDGNGYELKRYTVNKKDGTVNIQWTENEKGLALGFNETETPAQLTQK